MAAPDTYYQRHKEACKQRAMEYYQRKKDHYKTYNAEYYRDIRKPKLEAAKPPKPVYVPPEPSEQQPPSPPPPPVKKVKQSRLPRQYFQYEKPQKVLTPLEQQLEGLHLAPHRRAKYKQICPQGFYTPQTSDNPFFLTFK